MTRAVPCMRYERMLRALLYVALLCTLQVNAQDLSAARDGQRPASADPQTQHFAGPLKLFDNLYYLGTNYVSAWLLVTSDGLILIDSLYREFTAEALQAVTELGYDPRDVRYLLVTHGHSDHAGGIAEVKTATGARVGMSAADWELAGLTPEMVVNDGDILALGDTAIRFWITPGHTAGVLSMQFTVRDAGNSHEAFLFGGHNVTRESAEAFSQFIGSVTRLQNELPEIEVNLTSHPWAALIFQRADLLKQRAPGAPHPFVDGSDFRAFLEERLQDASRRSTVLGNGSQ